MLVSCDTWCSGPRERSMPWMSASVAGIPASGSPPGRMDTSVSSSCGSYIQEQVDALPCELLYVSNKLSS